MRPQVSVLHPHEDVSSWGAAYARSLAFSAVNYLDVTCQPVHPVQRQTGDPREQYDRWRDPGPTTAAFQIWSSLIETRDEPDDLVCPCQSRVWPSTAQAPSGQGRYALTILVDWRYTGYLAGMIPRAVVAPLLCPAGVLVSDEALAVLERAEALICATDAEFEVATAAVSTPAVTIGWSEELVEVAENSFRVLHQVRGPVIVCADPVSPTDPVLDLVLGFWSALRDRPQIDDKTLVLRSRVPFEPPRPDVMVIDANDRQQYDLAIATAEATFTMSLHDSVGADVHHSWMLGTPVLVPSANRFLARQVRLATGGLTFSNIEEFIRGVSSLVANKKRYSEPATAWLKRSRHPATLGRRLADLVRAVNGGRHGARA